MDSHVEPQPQPQPKRRKVRKGTRTCWECKRRKVRCTFEKPDDDTCVGCSRRCFRCISQEFPEETATAAVKSRLVGDRIVRVEALIQRLVQQSGNNGGTATAAALADIINLPTPQNNAISDSSPGSNNITPGPTDTPTSASTPRGVQPLYSTSIAKEGRDSSSIYFIDGHDTTDPVSHHEQTTENISDSIQRQPHTIVDLQPPVHLLAQSNDANDRLSEALLAVYPPQQDIDLIASRTSLAYNYYQLVFRSHRDIQQGSGFWPTSELRIRHTAKTHPVVIARQMLIIACVLQVSDLSGRNELDSLSEPSSSIMAKLGNTAINLVTTNDSLLDTIDGLECIMLEAMYRGNSGYLRRAWLTWRHAFSMAQLMCIPRQNRSQAKSMRAANSGFDPQFLWYRITSAERFMSLLLGLPQASLDASVAPAEALGNDTPMSKLEYELCSICSHISDRNDRSLQADDYATTEKIDKEMQKIATALPGRWWLAPNLATLPPDDESVSETVRLSDQIFYYHLLHQLHLPYMMYRRSSTVSEADQKRFEYSRITCVSSSREILTRYIVFRNFNKVACCYRFVELFALMASLTLILIHLDGHKNASHVNSFLAHQRLSDRAMTEEVLESMEQVRQLNEDAISETSVKLLRQLLAIEADTARGSDHTLESCDDDVRSAGELRITVPYVGLVTIGRDGTVTKEMHERAPTESTSLARSSIATLPTTTSNVPHTEASAPMRQAPVSGPVFPPSLCGDLAPDISTTSPAEQRSDANGISGLASSSSTQLCIERRLHDCTPRENSLCVQAQHMSANCYSTPTSVVESMSSTAPLQYLSQPSYPRPTAGSDQWAFQGVDMAFFENLIRDTSTETLSESNNLWM